MIFCYDKLVRHHHLQFILFLIYLVLATILMIRLGVGLTPDRYLVVLLIGSLFVHKTFKFLHDFLPFLLIILSYDFLRGFADDLNPHIHYLGRVHATQLLFNGHIPTVELQSLFYTPGVLHWYDYAASFLYLLHFAVPFALAFVLWLYYKKGFFEFSLGLSLVSYAALLFYLIYPTAPPWLASQHHFIPPVTKIFDLVMANFQEVVKLPTVYRYIGGNLVAAVPSMHAAYSFLVFLYAVRYFKKWGLIFSLPYFLLIWISIVYLGEHYVVDILLGAALDLIFFYISIMIVKNFKFFRK